MSPGSGVARRKAVTKPRLLGRAPGFPHRQRDVVGRQHSGALEPRRILLAEIVEPVVVGPADGLRQQRIHVGHGHDVQAGGGEQHRHVQALDVHGLELGLGIEPLGSREVDHVLARDLLPLADHARIVGQGRALGPRLLAVQQQQVEITAARDVDDSRRVLLERRIDVVFPEVHRLHDVHVGVDDFQSVFHRSLPSGGNWLFNPNTFGSDVSQGAFDSPDSRPL